MIELSRNCRRHRAALVDFLDRGEVRDPDTGNALSHLDRCDRCTVELETTVLAITALRRLGDDAGQVEPSAEAWPRLRARLDRWRPARWAIMSPTAGMVMSMALVVVLIAPLQIGSAAPSSSPAAGPLDRSPVTLTERRVEINYIQGVRHRSISDSLPVAREAGTLPRRYPDNYQPEHKEVSPAAPSGRPSEAI